MKDAVLKAMKQAAKPMNIGEVVALTGIDRAEVEKAFAQLKKEEAIYSPVRCKWQAK